MALITGWVTDTGQRRAENQDAVFVHALDGGEVLLAAVADGMGGLANGSIASAEAIAALEAAVTSELGPESLVAAFGEAHQRIRGRTAPGTEPMGTTLVALLVREGMAYVANVGDSRAYMVGASATVQITNDHSVAGEQMETGLIGAEEALTSPLRNVLTRALGPEEEAPAVDIFGPLLLRKGDCIVLCSDGLHTLVEPDEIAAAVREMEPQDAADGLVRLANERGGFDNISVVVVAVQEGALR